MLQPSLQLPDDLIPRNTVLLKESLKRLKWAFQRLPTHQAACLISSEAEQSHP